MTVTSADDSICQNSAKTTTTSLGCTDQLGGSYTSAQAPQATPALNGATCAPSASNAVGSFVERSPTTICCANKR